MNKLNKVLDNIKTDLITAHQSSSYDYKNSMIQRALGKLDALLILLKEDK